MLDEDELTACELGETEEIADEASSLGGGAIRGYTGPLGQKVRDDDQEEVNQKSFGGGNYVK